MGLRPATGRSSSRPVAIRFLDLVRRSPGGEQRLADQVVHAADQTQDGAGQEPPGGGPEMAVPEISGEDEPADRRHQLEPDAGQPGPIASGLRLFRHIRLADYEGPRSGHPHPSRATRSIAGSGELVKTFTSRGAQPRITGS